MIKSIGKATFVLLAAVGLVVAAHAALVAQQVTGPGGGQKVRQNRFGLLQGQNETVKFRLERGGKIAVDNRTTGRIVIIGWDKDFIEAKATSERGAETVRFSLEANESVERDLSDQRHVTLDSDVAVKSIWVKADYAKRAESSSMPVSLTPMPKLEVPPAPAPPAQSVAPPTPQDSPKVIKVPDRLDADLVIDPPRRGDKPLEVHLEVRVPRTADIEVVRVIRSVVEITGVETPLTILGNRGEVILNDVGAAEVRTKTGAVRIDKASGLVDIVTASGPISVRRAGGDVRVLTIDGAVDLECVRGRAEVDTTSGPVKLDSVDGDVDAGTSNGDLFFTGGIRHDGTYHLKSMSGSVEMALRGEPPGFTATLSSYRGLIENKMQLKIKQASNPEETVNRRILGRFGNGQARITLDTFDGKVKLGKAQPGSNKECR